MRLTHRDVNLGNFVKHQTQIAQLVSGDALMPYEDGCYNTSKQSVLTFSKRFKTQIENMKKRGYELSRAKVNFVVYWYNSKLKKEFAIILPELSFRSTKSK